MHIEQNFVTRNSGHNQLAMWSSKSFGLVRGREIAIQVAIAIAAAVGVRSGIGDRYKRHLPGHDANVATLDVGQDAADCDRPANFVAMHAAGDDEFVGPSSSPRIRSPELIVFAHAFFACLMSPHKWVHTTMDAALLVNSAWSNGAKLPCNPCPPN